MFLVVPKTRITLTRERSSPEISWCWTLEGLERTDLLARAALIRKIISCEFGQGVEPVLLWPQPDVPSRLHVSVSGFSPFSKIKKTNYTNSILQGPRDSIRAGSSPERKKIRFSLRSRALSAATDVLSAGRCPSPPFGKFTAFFKKRWPVHLWRRCRHTWTVRVWLGLAR